MKIGALSLFRRGNGNWWVVAGWHWPSSITWRWSFTYALPVKPYRIKYFYIKNNSGFYAGLFLWRIGSLTLHTQENMFKKEV